MYLVFERIVFVKLHNLDLVKSVRSEEKKSLALVPRC